MPSVYNKSGIHFDYPDNWTLEEHSEGEVVQVVVSSPQTAYWHLCKHPRNTELEPLFDEGLAALRVQYPGMEVELAEDLADSGGWFDPQTPNAIEQDKLGLTGYDVNFICLDLTVTAWLRGIKTPRANYFLFCQAEDRELSAAGLVFRAMWISLLRNEARVDPAQT